MKTFSRLSLLTLLFLGVALMLVGKLLLMLNKMG